MVRIEFIKLKKPEKDRLFCELAEEFLEQGQRSLIIVHDENQGVTLDRFMELAKGFLSSTFFR